MDYKFQHIQLPSAHNFDEEHLMFLKTLDEAFVKGSITTASLQKQINDMYVELAKHGTMSYGQNKQYSKEQKDLTVKWIKNFIRNKDNSQTEMELKQFESYMNIADGTAGGYLVPELLANEINHFVEQGGIARREMRYMPFVGPGNTRTLPTESAGVNVSWLDEGESKPISNITIGKVIQTMKKVAAISVITEELAEDAGVDLVSYLAQRIGEAIATAEDDQFFAGTGAPWTGLVNDPLIPLYSLAAGVGPLNMRPEALLGIINSVPSGAMAGAKFYMHRTVWAAICARRADAVSADDTKGMYLIQQPSQGTLGMIWGYPVVPVEAMPSMTDLGYGEGDTECDPDEPFLLFGNLQKCCVYGDKNQVRVKLLDQATLVDEQENSISLAQNDMIGVRVHKRTGYVTTLPSGLSLLATGPVS